MSLKKLQACKDVGRYEFAVRLSELTIKPNNATLKKMDAVAYLKSFIGKTIVDVQVSELDDYNLNRYGEECINSVVIKCSDGSSVDLWGTSIDNRGDSALQVDKG